MALNYKSDLSWLPTTLTPSTIVDVASTGTLNNVSTKTTDSVVAVLRFTGAEPTVTGLQAARRLIHVMAVGGPLVLANESASSIAANRIVTGTGGDATIAQGAVALLIYDPTASRWRMGGVGADVSTVNGAAPQAGAQVETTDATQTAIGSAITLATDSVTTVDVAVQCIQAGAAKAKVFSIRRSFLNDGGVVTDGTQTDLITAEELGGALAASVDITRTGTTVQPKVTGVAATELRWYLIAQSQKVTAAAAAALPAPTVTSLSPNTGSTAGGTASTITGTGFVAGATVTIGGVAATGVTWVNATSITCTTPAGAAGAQDVVVTNPDAQTGTLAGGFTYSAAFDLATLPLSLFLDTDYTASPWTDKASAGTSGGQTFTEATHPPTASGGAAVFNGVDEKLLSAAGVVESDLFTDNGAGAAESGGVAILYRADAGQPAAGGAGVGQLSEPGIFVGIGGYLTCSVNSTGPRVGIYDTGYNSIQCTAGEGVDVLVMFRWTWDPIGGSGTMEASVNGGAWSTPQALTGPMGDLTSQLRIGANHDESLFFAGQVKRILAKATAWTDTERDDIASACGF